MPKVNGLLLRCSFWRGVTGTRRHLQRGAKLSDAATTGAVVTRVPCHAVSWLQGAWAEAGGLYLLGDTKGLLRSSASHRREIIK